MISGAGRLSASSSDSSRSQVMSRLALSRAISSSYVNDLHRSDPTRSERSFAGQVRRHEVVEVMAAQRVLLEREGLAGAQVEDPQPAGPRLLGDGFPEQHVGLHALGVEDAGRQAQHGVQVEVGQQLLAQGLTGASLEEHVVGSTTAARPLMSRIVVMCWTKLSCLLLVVTTKSWRSISRWPGRRSGRHGPRSVSRRRACRRRVAAGSWPLVIVGRNEREERGWSRPSQRPTGR